jgi:hypothetical protein
VLSFFFFFFLLLVVLAQCFSVGVQPAGH